jgi:tetratricopeptide (TPR) repeat protein
MRRTRTTITWLIAAIALGAIAVWPWYVRTQAQAARVASLPTPAPVPLDYQSRDKTIAFWERAAGERHAGDMLSPNNLSALYLQRYRERGDIDDVVRAQHMAERALRAQPRGNAAAEVALASAFVALHRFRDALALTKDVETYQPGDPDMLVREASIDLELGRYADAKQIVDRLSGARATGRGAIPFDTLVTRYDELTGHLARARERFERTTAYANADFGAGAQQRAWFYFRAGELAFEAGDNAGAIAAEQRALQTFPNYSEANRVLARVQCANHQWQACLDAAKASAAVVPYPEVLGYEVDAQRALGDTAGADANDALIHTIERIGNAQRVSDRLLAVYYAGHHENVDDAYRIATRELAVRDDIFTEDTLAWCAAMAGHWDEARARIGKAVRYGTENALLDYHAGIIALHAGDRDAARRWLDRAVALNPQFDGAYADDARAKLTELR